MSWRTNERVGRAAHLRVRGSMRRLAGVCSREGTAMIKQFGGQLAVLEARRGGPRGRQFAAVLAHAGDEAVAEGAVAEAPAIVEPVVDAADRGEEPGDEGLDGGAAQSCSPCRRSRSDMRLTMHGLWDMS